MLPIASQHLVISFANVLDSDGQLALQKLPCGLRNLQKLLQSMRLDAELPGQENSLSPPHERALAGQDFPDGLIPWAAIASGAPTGQGMAFVTLCHWAMGREHATLTDPAALHLPEADSRQLLGDVAPYFATEGIKLTYDSPTRWLATGEVFKTLPTASLDRVLGRNVDAWLPASGRRDGPPLASPAPSGGSAVRAATSVGARKMKLLQNEMQMLLYTHPVNEARAAQRLPAVNSFWLSGSGALAGPAPPLGTQNRSLAASALAADWPAYAAAWAALDSSVLAEWVARQNSGQALRLSLCGERNALTYASAKPSLFAQLKNVLSPRPASTLLSTL